jgi:hypothetical protein
MVLWACRFAIFMMVFGLAIDSISLATWYYFLLFLIERGRWDSIRREHFAIWHATGCWSP